MSRLLLYNDLLLASLLTLIFLELDCFEDDSSGDDVTNGLMQLSKISSKRTITPTTESPNKNPWKMMI